MCGILGRVEKLLAFEVAVAHFLVGVDAVLRRAKTRRWAFSNVSPSDSIEPWKVLNEPVTVEMTKCFTLNCTSECMGSRTHLVAVAAVLVSDMAVGG